MNHEDEDVTERFERSHDEGDRDTIRAPLSVTERPTIPQWVFVDEQELTDKGAREGVLG